MLAETLRGDFTKEAREAWITLYGTVPETMLAGTGAHQDSGKWHFYPQAWRG
jgi:hypothetical protein